MCVLTGGQTGVDTAAARAALGAGLPVHLVFPRGFRQEDGPLTTARRRGLHGAVLHELASGEFAHRTRTCVYLSDAVILIDPAGGEGCRETQRSARDLGRPLLTLARERDPLPGGPGEADDRREPGTGAADPDEVADWIERTQARVLMVAGCRGSMLAAAGCERLAAELAAVVAAATRRRNVQLTS
jgi:Circularly permutated YpsA SLOG family